MDVCMEKKGRHNFECLFKIMPAPENLKRCLSFFLAKLLAAEIFRGYFAVIDSAI